MKLMWILPYTPTMIRTRSYNLLKALVERGHDVTLAAIWESQTEQAALKKLQANGVRVIGVRLGKPQIAVNLAFASIRGHPLQSRYSWSPSLTKKIGALLRENAIDAVHIEHMRGSAYAEMIYRWLTDSKLTMPLIWDSVDCISSLFEQSAQASRSFFGRWVTRLELPRSRRLERHMVRSFQNILVTSHNDKTALERLAGKPLPNVSVLPNGVDMAYFCLGNEPKEPAEVLFSGKMSYHANETAALHLVQDIMPYVWAQRPDVRVVLVGKDPSVKLHRLQNTDRRVEITGTVDDMRPYLQRATVASALVPYGTGIQNKVLEAMACGTAVVGNPQAGAALQITPGKEMLVVEGVEAQARGLLSVLENAGLRTQLERAGRVYVENYHNWAKIAGDLERLYQIDKSTISED